MSANNGVERGFIEHVNTVHMQLVNGQTTQKQRISRVRSGGAEELDSIVSASYSIQILSGGSQ